jgi:hypothetical protein
MSEQKQNKWQQGLTRFVIPALDDYMGMRDGFLPLPVILDPAAGAEVGLFVRDQTPFMEELRQVNPFRLMMKNGCARNDFGPLVFILFWVENPADPTEPFSSWDCYVDPKNETQMRLWRNLAAQTHWHLFLVGTAGQQRGFFEFENNYGLGEALDFFEKACRNVGTIDFNRAKERFMNENKIEDLFQMQSAEPVHSAQVGAGNNWRDWEARTHFRRRAQELADRHRANPDLTAQEYLGQMRIELAGDLEDKKLIYLDTKYWVNLRHVVTQSPLLLPIYDEILGLLELLRQKKRICCPTSSALFEELMKQNDGATRLATARMMDYLSGGACVQYWLNLVQMEFARHVHRTLRGGEADEATFPAWTKAGYWAGEHTVNFPHLPGEDDVLMAKVYIDLRWNMTFEEYQAMPDWTPIPDEGIAAWVKAADQKKGQPAGSKPTFEQLVKQSRVDLFDALKDEFLRWFAIASGLPGNPKDHVEAVLGPIYEGRDPKAVPSLEVVAGLSAALALEANRKVQPNDMLDFLHAAQALPYCDALFCDKFMAQKMRNKPLEFGKVYDTHIGSSPEELLDYLKRIS